MAHSISYREARELLKGKRRPAAITVGPVVQLDGVMLETGYVLLVLPVPSSRNAAPSHWAARRKAKLAWSRMACEAWLAAGRPKMGRVELCPVIFHRDARKRDCDNYCDLAAKGFFDGLKGHLIADDNSEYLTLHPVEFLVDRGYPRMELHVIERSE